MKKISICSLFAVLLLNASAVTPFVLESAYNPANGHTYYLLSESDWLSAESSAVSLGGHLVSINNQLENDWIFNKWGQTRSLLIGLTDDGHEGAFNWTSGEAFSFANWASGEPNNAVGWGPGPENYVYMYADGWGDPGKWNDYQGGGIIAPQPGLFGVVEVPEPTVGTLALAATVLAVLKCKQRSA